MNDADQTEFDQAEAKLQELAKHSEVLDVLEEAVQIVGPLALELGLSFAPGGSAAATFLKVAQKALPAVLERAGKA